MRVITNLFQSIWQKIKPSRKTKAIIITGLQMIGIMATSLMLGLIIDVLFLGYMGGLSCLTLLLYGTYYSISHSKEMYLQNYAALGGHRDNLINNNHSNDFANGRHAVSVMNLENTNSALIKKLHEETTNNNPIFNNDEVSLLQECTKEPIQNQEAMSFLEKEDNNAHLKFVAEHLICPIGAPNEIMNNPITICLKDKNDIKITNTYDRLNLLTSLEAKNLVEPLSGVKYLEGKEIRFNDGFSFKKSKSIIDEYGDTLQQKIFMIKQSIIDFNNPFSFRNFKNNKLLAGVAYKQNNKSENNTGSSSQIHNVAISSSSPQII